jgi:hypothetical protein
VLGSLLGSLLGSPLGSAVGSPLGPAVVTSGSVWVEGPVVVPGSTVSPTVSGPAVVPIVGSVIVVLGVQLSPSDT